MNKRAATIGLGVFLLADIVLVALALRPPPVDTNASVTPLGTARPASTAAPTTGGEATAEPTSPPAETTTPPPAGPVPVQRMIVGIDADNAWRATMGSCESGGSSVEVTTDGGATWTDAGSPSEAIARIQPLQNGAGFLYAAGPDCSLQEWTTVDNGATWAGPKAIVGGWTRQIATATAVMVPKEPAAQPCGKLPVLDLSRTSAEQAEALCANGDVLVTNDGGSTWGDSGSAPGALALSNRLEGGILTTYAAQLNDTCAGVQVVKVIQGQPAAPVACVETTAPPEPGQVGISAAPTAGWLLIGDDTWTSGADLTSWNPA